MINTIFHFVNDPTFDYGAAVTNGDISEYTIVFNAADRSIRAKNSMYGRMSRADMAEVLGNMSDLLPVATNSALGAIKIGYTSNTDPSARRYGVMLDESNRAYVEVPWTDTITPVFDDTELKSLITTERNRINNFISTIGDTIDAKNRELYADAAWVNSVFGDPALLGTVAHAFRNEVDLYLSQYAVWDWVDPNDHTKGRVARISEMRQDVDSITLRVGTAEDNISANTTDIGALEVRAGAVESYAASIESKADATDIALSSFKQETNTEISGIKTAHTNLSSSVTTYENTNDGNLGNIIKMAASVLDLKSSANAQGQLTSTADLASVITNGSFSGYSGLASKVQEIDGAYVSQNSLTSQIQALDINGQISNATAGLATESFVRTTASDEADAAETAAKGYADNIVAGAKAEVVASIDDVVAGLGVYVTKDTNGLIESTAKLSADNIYLNGNTWAQYIGVGQIVADTLTAGTATIDAATINSANITGTLSGVNGTFSGSLSAATGTFSGELSAATGSFTGNVNATGGSFTGNILATQFIAGDAGGLNITTTGDAISFNYGGDRRAWFTTKDENDNETNGMFLYVKGPNGELITIDFTGLKFKNANVSGSAVQLRNFYRNVTDSSYVSSIFINTADGKYYSDSQLLSNTIMGTTSGYYYEKMTEGHVLVSENGYNIIYPASFFNKVSFNNGDKVIADSNYWVTTTINGRIKELRGTTSAGTFYDYNTYLETTSNLISLNSYLDLNGNSIYSAFTGTAGGGYISNLIFVSRTNGATIVGERVYTIHS